MTINTHGLSINLEDLKTVSEETYNVDWRRGHRLQVYFDRDTGNLWTKFYFSDSNWTVYHNPAIISVCCPTRHHSQQWLADRIKEAVDEAAFYDKIEEEEMARREGACWI